jgi:small subunit ribosomal protein S20
MANIASAIKALRQSQKRAARNRERMVVIKDLSRHFRKAIEAKDEKRAEELLNKLVVAIDKAAQKNILKANTASRKKSRLTKRFNAIKK